MSYETETLKRMGKYATSFAVLGMTTGILVLTARNLYQDFAYPEEIRMRLSPKQKEEYIAHENKIYCTVFAVSGLIGIVSGTVIGFQKSKNNNHQEEHEACPHCHYHF